MAWDRSFPEFRRKEWDHSCEAPSARPIERTWVGGRAARVILALPAKLANAPAPPERATRGVSHARAPHRPRSRATGGPCSSRALEGLKRARSCSAEEVPVSLGERGGPASARHAPRDAERSCIGCQRTYACGRGRGRGRGRASGRARGASACAPERAPCPPGGHGRPGRAPGCGRPSPPRRSTRSRRPRHRQAADYRATQVPSQIRPVRHSLPANTS